jgi:hypothetical protein
MKLLMITLFLFVCLMFTSVHNYSVKIGLLVSCSYLSGICTVINFKSLKSVEEALKVLDTIEKAIEKAEAGDKEILAAFETLRRKTNKDSKD